VESGLLTSAEIRARARGSLAGNWKYAVLHFLVYYLILIGIGFVGGFIHPIVTWIANLLLTGALTYGVYNYYLTLVRGTVPTINDLFKGFDRFVPTFLLYLLSAIFTALWMLLLIIPGIIAVIRYSQAYYILRDHPDIGALEAIRRSKALMVGHKWRYFVLGLSFIGWFILGLIPCGIGVLWVAPYFYTALGHFYEDLVSRSEQLPPPPSPYEDVTA
jgi:uncharacterized membrane protein